MNNEIVWSKFNWSGIYGAAENMKSMSDNMSKFISAQVLEKAVEKYSCGQLKYVGDTEDGLDFIGIDGLRYELKSANKIYQPTTPYTKWLTLKNFRGNSTGITKTFDKIIAIDKGLYTTFLSDFEDLEMEEKGANINCRLYKSTMETISENDFDITKVKDINVAEKYNKLIEDII